MTDTETRNHLKALATALRHFHSALLDVAKREYESKGGTIDGPFTLYNLVLNDASFQWLRPLSGLMATLDEVIDSKERLSDRNVQDVRGALGLLFSPADTNFADFRAGYERAKNDKRVQDTEKRWRDLVRGLEA
ncbi:hypothetical protein [Deinococcus yavapaiensis]|uniref:Uncharacterized protein n=1 Tax=Deinococcus yavapaiensis KR-236 TaxID=694435 RepID=A0A318SAS6_9DEIO|nr:hypothetical protein [Deinococcus yavapaiensis]PYE55320.1 hypothetical protein DES52_103153 [Deinococcus yavapaiensis KR-236]